MGAFVNSSLSPLQDNVLKAFRYVVPDPEDRIALTWATAWRQMLCVVPVIYMAYLARRPGTYHIRLAILPLATYFTLHAMYGYAWMDPQFRYWNFAQSCIFMVVLSKAIDFGLSPAGMLKKGEIEPGVYSADYKPPPGPPTISQLLLPTWLLDTVHLLVSTRGLDYQFSEGIHIPSPTRPQSPTSSFLIATLPSLIIHFLRIDFLEASWKLFMPVAGRTVGATIFDPSLPIYPIPWRYIASTATVAGIAFAMQAQFDFGYDLVTLIGVGLLGQQPRDWPPIMEYPWHSDSLHVYWGRRWHQVIRRTLIVLGGYPAQWTTTTILNLLGANDKVKKKAGDMAMLLGVFVACGLFHEGAAYTFGLGFNHWGWIFYALQGPLMVGERIWKRITGRQVQGWWGTFWVAFVLLVGPQKLFNSWVERGLGVSIFIPPMISPTRRVIFPLVKVGLSWAGVEDVI